MPRTLRITLGWPASILVTTFVLVVAWAGARDPFERRRFSLETGDGEKCEGIAVLPKPFQPCPVIVFLHGSPGAIIEDGNSLRQFAELGMAAVSIQYNQTNAAVFDDQFVALLRYLTGQKWARSNAVAWVGYSMGAQKILSFILAHPEVRPQVIARISGGQVPESRRYLNLINQPSPFPIQCPVLLINGVNDSIFPAKEVQALADWMRANGVKVTQELLPGHDHGLQPDRALVNRLVGEYCKSILAPDKYFAATTRGQSFSFLLCIIVGGIFACYFYHRPIIAKKSEGPIILLPTPGEKILHRLALLLALLAVTVTAFHSVIPYLAVGKTTLAVARRFLVAAGNLQDFDYLAADSIWRGKPLKTLLEHVEMASYAHGEWDGRESDQSIYQQFILSPRIDSESLQELDWRRLLWENLNWRVRKEPTRIAAIESVVRYLRQRVMVGQGSGSGGGIRTSWERGIADEKGFERLSVAALRSVGIGARLNGLGKAEFWTGNQWVRAARPFALTLQQPNAALIRQERRNYWDVSKRN